MQHEGNPGNVVAFVSCMSCVCVCDMGMFQILFQRCNLQKDIRNVINSRIILSWDFARVTLKDDATD